MLRWTLITFLTLPFCAVAGTDSYSCSVAQILELNKEGAFAKHEGIFKGLLGETFTIDRTTGKMFGLPFGTESYKSVTVLDKGSKDNSYKAIALSHEPNMWVKYVYVAEHQPGKKKPFWGTDDGNKIFSGICE